MDDPKRNTQSSKFQILARFEVLYVLYVLSKKGRRLWFRLRSQLSQLLQKQCGRAASLWHVKTTPRFRRFRRELIELIASILSTMNPRFGPSFKSFEFF